MTVDELFEELILDTSQEDWDGYGSKPINRDAVECAKAVVLGLPEDTRWIPSLSADSDGEVCLDWMTASKGRIVSANINAQGEIAWAAMCDDDKDHGLTTLKEFNLMVFPWIRRILK
jgi:hypothetical protein